MLKRFPKKALLRSAGGFILLLLILLFRPSPILPFAMKSDLELLTEPFLQLPTETSVRVVWFTEFAGVQHFVSSGKNLDNKTVATTTKLSRVREDERSRFQGRTKDNIVFNKPILRNIWRHEAVVEGLVSGAKIPYFVSSVQEDGKSFKSAIFSLAPAPLANQSLKILLTSDHQLMPMTAANLQKVEETIGQVDAVFFAGDLVNIPDRASEWFDDQRGGAFFPCLQGRAFYELEKNGIKTIYKGGKIIQNAPLFPATGNHEVMGRYSIETSLNEQYNDAIPRQVATDFYNKIAQQINPNNDLLLREAWIKDNSFNTDTFREIFSLPDSGDGGKNYYALTFGDVRLVSLYVTNIWRTFNLDDDARGKYRERKADLKNPEAWGYGQHIFERIDKGSKQYQWLENELNSDEFKRAKFKMVMLHHPAHSLGANIVPAFTDPVPVIVRNEQKEIVSIRYEYPLEDDYIIRDVVPLLEKAGVQLVFYGHSHIWNRFLGKTGMHFLESSNVGNSYGAAVAKNPRPVPVGYEEEYVAIGDPNGLEPVLPSISSILGEDGKAQAFIGSNDLTVFSIFDTGKGTVSSYYFDTRKPESNVIKFDEFKLRNRVF